MPQLVIEGQTRSLQTLLDYGITDLVVHQTANGPVLYATSGPNGGLSAYSIGPAGDLTLIDFAHFQSSFSDAVMERLTLLETTDGPQLVVAGTTEGHLTAYDIGADGMIGGATFINGLAGPTTAVLDIDQWGGNMLFLANAEGGSIQGYAIDAPTQLSERFTVSDTATTYAAAVFALETVSLGGNSYLLGACVADCGVTAYRIDAVGLVATGSLGIAEGIGIMTPTTLATAEIGGRQFVLLGSAPGDGAGRSGAITVMELRPDGSLVPTDHVIDTLHTRFGMIQTLDVVEANGMTYVVAGGGDDGLTIFVLMPNGRLQLLDVLVDNADGGLGNVTAVASFYTGTDLRMFISSEASGGVTEVSLATARNGATLVAGGGGGRTTGTGLDDIILGGAGNDLLEGSFGDDIIEDGGGSDTLTGGGGRDIFVLRADGETDIITDFEPGRDRLDLSGWPFLYDTAGLSVQSTADGAIVTWRGEILVIHTLNGTSLTAATVRAAVINAPNRTPLLWDAPPSPHGYHVGTSGADLVDGGDGNDTISGLEGNDTLIGGSGDDMLAGSDGFDLLRGGEGDDYLDGGAQADNLYGDAGNDSLVGGLGNDRLFGGVGNDSLLGGDGDDGLWGEAGHDTLFGEAGADRLYGGSGEDLLFGGDGDDTLWGDAGFDTLHGGAGDDSLVGGAQADFLFGGDGNDTARGGDGMDNIYGEAGDDILYGDASNDRLFGGAGHDILYGGTQEDRLYGDDGNDTLFGGAGFDVLAGGDGEDYLDGGAQADNLYGDAGNDTLVGGGGFDRLFGGSGNDLLFGGSDDDALFGESGDDTLHGEAGNDRMFGDSGNDILYGGEGNDQFNGGSGFDTLIGGTGNDALWGAFNADIFVFADGHGVDTIYDFDAQNSLEKIDFSELSTVNSIHDVLGPDGAATQIGGDVRIDTGGGNSLWLMNVALADLDASDFLF